MKPAAFDYYAPPSLENALELCARFGDSHKVLAGGQSLVPLMNMRMARPEQIVDLNRIPELASINSSGEWLEIGAMTRQADTERSPAIHTGFPVLAEALSFVAHPAIRNRGTIGGSIAHADPAAEVPLAWLVSEGFATVDGPRGRRSIDSSAFFTSVFSTAMEADEVLIAVCFRSLGTGWGHSFQEVALRHGDFAIVSACVLLELVEEEVRSVRIGLGSVAPTPIRAGEAEKILTGQKADEDVLVSCADAAIEGLWPTGDIHASADYRRHIAKVLTKRALHVALKRAALDHRA